MNCPYCLHSYSKVTNKRPSPEGVRRRRECKKCKKRFTTYERAEKGGLYIIKKDGKREAFDIKKLEKGINIAFEKRPISKDKISKMVREIEDTLRKKGKKEIKSSVIGELAMKKIKKLDNVAYIRFASVYRDFQDVKDFRDEIKGL